MSKMRIRANCHVGRIGIFISIAVQWCYAQLDKSTAVDTLNE
jgi:hypothetical protein